jgi:spermidine synthase
VSPLSLAPTTFRLLLFLSFFLSGAAALVFEVIWTRLLLLQLGATSVAVAAVLGAFMAGMAVGSAVAGRKFLASRDPLLTYALLEGWAGLYGLATPFLIDAVIDLPQPLRFAFGLASLLPATIVMGASLPVLARAVGVPGGSPGSIVGRLYAANTAGAVVGPLVAVFFLFPRWGLSRALHVASATDIAICLVLVGAWALHRRGLAQAASEEQADSEKASPPRPALLIAVGTSAGTAMMYEVAWSRTTSLVFGSSVYGVSVMLSTFLFGLTLGAAWIARWLRHRREPVPLSYCAYSLVGSAVLGAVSLVLARSLPLLFLELYRSLPGFEGTVFFIQFLLSALLMLPCTICLGAMLPLATAAAAPASENLGKTVSWLYTANLIGSTAGTLLAAGLMMESLGIETTVRVASLLALATSWFLFARERVNWRGAIASAAAALMLLGFDPTWDPVAKSFGVYANPAAFARLDAAGLRAQVEAHQLLYYRDGPTASVSVQEVAQFRLLKINGKTDASNGHGDVKTQILAGHLPLLASHARRVAVIGWGSGMTVGAVLAYPVESVDAFEIEPAVVEASHFFDHVNGRPLEDPRVKLHLGDARSEFRRRKDVYDLIISEPSNPWLTGVANLFTQDFFELAASRLAPDGIHCQWFQLYGMSEASTRTLVATFRSVYPHAVAFGGRDLFVLGSRRPIRFDLGRMTDFFKDRTVEASLNKISIRYPLDVFLDLRLDASGTARFSEAAPINTDDNMRIELSAPRTLYGDRVDAILAAMTGYSASIEGLLSASRDPTEVTLELAASLFTAGDNERALEACQRALAARPSFEAQKLLGQILHGMGRLADARTALQEALDMEGAPEGRRFVQALLRAIENGREIRPKSAS